jgi:hypothetical protein
MYRDGCITNSAAKPTILFSLPSKLLDNKENKSSLRSLFLLRLPALVFRTGIALREPLENPSALLTRALIPGMERSARPDGNEVKRVDAPKY